MASTTTCGSPSKTDLSINAPGSPSSALQQTYFIAFGSARERPLSAGGETCAAPAAKSACKNFVYNLLRSHFCKHFVKRLIPVATYIFFYALGVDCAAVVKRHPVLFFHKLGFFKFPYFPAVNLYVQ